MEPFRNRVVLKGKVAFQGKLSEFPLVDILVAIEALECKVLKTNSGEFAFYRRRMNVFSTCRNVSVSCKLSIRNRDFELLYNLAVLCTRDTRSPETCTRDPQMS